MSNWTCPECSKTIDARGRTGHERKHSAAVARAQNSEAAAGEATSVNVVSPAAVTKGQPAIIPSWRQTNILRFGLRQIKLLRAICRICEAEDPPRPNWMRDCPHDPYVSVIPGPIVKKRIYGEPNPDGSRPILRTEDVEGPPELRPNRHAVALSAGLTNGVSVTHAIWRKGRIFPQDLGTIVPSQDFPYGIAPACEFYNCWNQNGIKTYRSGNFCREVEAQLVAYHEGAGSMETMLEVGWNQGSSARRAEMLRTVNVAVEA